MMSSNGSLCFVGDFIPTIPLQETDETRFTVLNLECAFSNSLSKKEKAYTSILPFANLDLLPPRSSFAFSLANNHVYDSGGNGFDKMIEYLNQREIVYFGTTERPYAEISLFNQKIAVVGCLEPCRSRGAKIFKQEKVEALIRSIRNAFQFVYVYPHWGKEGEYTRWPSPAQRLLARRWIDVGADGVLGSHSHVFQGREIYRGKPIYYSLGNYCFNHPEGKLYAGTNSGLAVEVEANGHIREFIKPANGDLQEVDAKERQLLDEISLPLASWTTWKWANTIGPFNLKKNMASWKIRLQRHFWKTLPKFLIWQILPQTLLFRLATIRQVNCRSSIT